MSGWRYSLTGAAKVMSPWTWPRRPRARLWISSTDKSAGRTLNAIFVEPDEEEGNFVIRDTQEYAIVSSWYTREAALEEIKRMVGRENAKQKGEAQ